jgi:hypothetical protein
VLAVVDRFMIGVSTNDSKGMSQLHLEGAVHIGVASNESGGSVVRRQDGTWRIANMIWTVEPEACPQLRPSDPARIRPAQ